MPDAQNKETVNVPNLRMLTMQKMRPGDQGPGLLRLQKALGQVHMRPGQKEEMIS
jgi:hypothetical protein